MWSQAHQNHDISIAYNIGNFFEYWNEQIVCLFCHEIYTHKRFHGHMAYSFQVVRCSFYIGYDVRILQKNSDHMIGWQKMAQPIKSHILILALANHENGVFMRSPTNELLLPWRGISLVQHDNSYKNCEKETSFWDVGSSNFNISVGMVYTSLIETLTALAAGSCLISWYPRTSMHRSLLST